MPLPRLGRRRRRRPGHRRRHDPSEPSRPPYLEEEKHVTQPASTQTSNLVAPVCLDECAEEEQVLDTAALKESSMSVTSSSSPLAEAPPGSRILSRVVRDWGTTFYIMVDLSGCYHTYPEVGGPFQSLEEVDSAIDRYLHDRQDPTICVKQEGVSHMEMVIRRELYWPDGTIKKRTSSYVHEKSRQRVLRLVQALVDKYNEDHNLWGDLAYELKDVLHDNSILENRTRYYHLNFTAKTKGADVLDSGVDTLFFAEVKRIDQGKHEQLLVTCFCMVKPMDNGPRCYGCSNDGNVDMIHPDSSEYVGGHMDVHSRCGCYGEWSESEDDDLQYVKVREAKVRRMYEGLLGEDPLALRKGFELPPGVTLA